MKNMRFLALFLSFTLGFSPVYGAVSAPGIYTGEGLQTSGSNLLTMPGLVSLQDGAAGGATAALYFANDTDTGIYRVGTNRLGLLSAGRLQLDIDDDSIALGASSRNVQHAIYKAGTGNASSIRIMGSPSSGGEYIGYGSGHSTKAGLSGIVTTLATNGTDAATLLNGPANTAGNPDIWFRLEVNGTTYVVPAWTP